MEGKMFSYMLYILLGIIDSLFNGLLNLIGISTEHIEALLFLPALAVNTIAPFLIFSFYMANKKNKKYDPTEYRNYSARFAAENGSFSHAPDIEHQQILTEALQKRSPGFFGYFILWCMICTTIIITFRLATCPPMRNIFYTLWDISFLLMTVVILITTLLILFATLVLVILAFLILINILKLIAKPIIGGYRRHHSAIRIIRMTNGGKSNEK